MTTTNPFSQLIAQSMLEVGGKFIAGGDEVTVGDLILIAATEHVDRLDPLLIPQKYHMIAKHRQDVMEHLPRLKAYCEGRADTSL